MWSHKKYGKNFKSSYERDKKGERIFVLTKDKKRVTFESHEAAKKLGWTKTK